ncbi:hypothetical protein OG864_45275 [Streptomyces sp. NBC_00124]|uniref:hypothetical protein n=1 Tax=Streptomyces sp. NBC_00124 TaxID=2975662 RepID=UPI00224F8EFE|nr:hypothetical protein [Streptomyces sp. NBC_00124]MCX5365915.1 hypothetical protein [Streptomyces sp. NBC_00124]
MPANDYTPTSDRETALHFAALAVGLAERRMREGNPLTADEHGFTDEEISDYLVNTLHPSLGITN